MNNPKQFPTFSIITPSFNQGKYIEQTIRSVLTQTGNFKLQYTVIDGGSTDNTIDILKKIEAEYKSGKYLNGKNESDFKWISEKDKGQSDAINKGFDLSDGDVMAWVNSDDYYFEGAFRKIVEVFEDEGIDFCYGDSLVIDEINKNKYVHITGEIPYFLLAQGSFFPSDSTFWRKSIHKRLNDRLRFALDYDLWCRMLNDKRGKYINEMLSVTRLHKDSKSSNLQDVCEEESNNIRKSYFRTTLYNKIHIKLALYRLNKQRMKLKELKFNYYNSLIE